MKFGRSDYDKRIIDTEGRIPEDEPCFFLRGTDKLAPRLLLNWATELRLAGGDPSMAKSAEDHAQRMIEWQRTHETKTPDMYHDPMKSDILMSRIKELLSEKNIDLNELTERIGQYYNTDGSQELLILMPMDLIKVKPLEEVTLEDLNTDSKLKLVHSKIVIYYDKSGSKVLLNKFN